MLLWLGMGVAAFFMGREGFGFLASRSEGRVYLVAGVLFVAGSALLLVSALLGVLGFIARVFGGR